MFYDSTFFCFIIPALILGFIVQLIVKGQFNKYSQVRTMRGMTGAQVAREILDSNGLQDVTVQETNGFLSDHYDPRTRTLNLSPAVARTPSVSAAGVAAHEAGHALVRKLIPGCDPVHKVSIVARGLGGGYVISLPPEDRYLENQSKFEAELSAILGGRAAEEVIFNEMTTGASDDLHKATKMARAMVTQYGMSKKLGPLTFGEKDEMVFLGKEIGEQRNYSEEIARQIDHEVRRIVGNAYDKAMRLLREHRAKLEEIAARLLKEETLDAQSFEAMFA